jgi:hypothetical protein
MGEIPRKKLGIRCVSYRGFAMCLCSARQAPADVCAKPSESEYFGQSLSFLEVSEELGLRQL